MIIPRQQTSSMPSTRSAWPRVRRSRCESRGLPACPVSLGWLHARRPHFRQHSRFHEKVPRGTTKPWTCIEPLECACRVSSHGERRANCAGTFSRRVAEAPAGARRRRVRVLRKAQSSRTRQSGHLSRAPRSQGRPRQRPLRPASWAHKRRRRRRLRRKKGRRMHSG